MRPARPTPRPRLRASTSRSRGPALRANPFPEVTDPICRLPLPTLFYRPEAVHLGDLLRMWVRPGAKFTAPPSDFHGATPALRTPPELRCSAEATSLSRYKPIPGSLPILTKKRELFPGPTPPSPSSLALPRPSAALPLGRSDGRSPRPGSGMLTRFPFDDAARALSRRRGL